MQRAGKPRPPADPDAEYIAAVVRDHGRELGDAAHSTANVTRALRIWHDSGLAADAFALKLHEARSRVRAAQGGQGKGQINRKMAYFFRVLADLLTTPAGEPLPAAAPANQPVVPSPAPPPLRIVPSQAPDVQRIAPPAPVHQIELPPGEESAPLPKSSLVQGMIMTYTQELGGGPLAMTTAHVQPALRLWQQSGLSETEFMKLLDQAFVQASQVHYRGCSGPNPYRVTAFFEVLTRLLARPVLPASVA